MVDSPSGAPRARRILNALKFILAILLAWFVISRADPDQARAVMMEISTPWLVAYAALFILSTLCKAFQYHLVIGKNVAYPRVLNVVVMQNVAANFLAASAGVASYVALFRFEHGVKASRAVIAFALTKVGDLVAIFFLLVVSAGWVWHRIGALRWVAVVLATGMGLVILLFFLAVLFREKFFSLLEALLARTRLSQFALAQKGMEFLETLVRQDQTILLRKMKGVIAGSFLYLIVTLFWLYAGLRTFDLRLGMWEIGFSSALFYLIAYLPIQVLGGLGVTEVSMMYVYGFFGLSPEELAAALIGLRILSYIMNLALLLYLPLYRICFRESDIDH